jgi:hypothetical protein
LAHDFRRGLLVLGPGDDDVRTGFNFVERHIRLSQKG